MDILGMYNIRQTEIADLDSVMAIFDYARTRMRESGNATQWVNGYPSRDVALGDIRKGNSYVIDSENGIIGVFTFVVGDEPNYSVIEGCWPDNNPYGTIHRIAAAPGARGIADIALGFWQGRSQHPCRHPCRQCAHARLDCKTRLFILRYNLCRGWNSPKSLSAVMQYVMIQIP